MSEQDIQDVSDTKAELEAYIWKMFCENPDFSALILYTHNGKTCESHWNAWKIKSMENQ